MRTVPIPDITTLSGLPTPGAMRRLYLLKNRRVQDKGGWEPLGLAVTIYAGAGFVGYPMSLDLRLTFLRFGH